MRSLLSPLIFKMILKELFLQNETLKRAIEEIKLVAFANDILLIADD